MKAMILAAGRGTRMGELTRSTPKPLLLVRDEPLIMHLLRNLREAGIRELVINLAWLGEQIADRLGDGSDLGLKIDYSVEEVDALGTGGGIKKALSLLGDEPFLVVNADLWTDYPFASLGGREVDSGHLVLVENPDHNAKGDFALVAENDAVSRVVPGNLYTYSGICLLHPGIFTGQPRAFQLGALFGELAGAGKLTGELFGGVWVDVGTPQRLAEVERL